jgi:hypothetical protein
VEISSPATDGTILPYNTNTIYVISACYSSTLVANATNFNTLINGALQPQSAYCGLPR